MEMITINKVILTSYGLTNEVGKKLIAKALKNENVSEKRIFIIFEPNDFIIDLLIKACLEIGFKKESIILSGQQKNIEEIKSCDIFYCTEGNTFEVLDLLKKKQYDKIIKEAFRKGNKIYIGASAGAMIAGESIEEAKWFDRNFIGTTAFEGLGLIEGIVIPHYTPKQLKNFINNTPEIVGKYKKIRQVSNEGILCLNTINLEMLEKEMKED